MMNDVNYKAWVSLVECVWKLLIVAKPNLHYTVLPDLREIGNERDTATINVVGGKGGNGCISFRRRSMCRAGDRTAAMAGEGEV